ncbi:6-carboxytetrahydropterin synthase QueD [Paenibacillus sp. y28]|uniref:6-carboxytetrahydropterin synthase QueD n=1 Tax=Paenibacillus sp. y28 TaxID=3129110 RepID=UPI00301B59B7
MIYQYYPQVPHGYKFELNKDMNFSAAHYIPVEAAGKCQRVHGHTYVINLTICGNDLDEAGFLVDFKQLKTLVHDRYDHTLLNEHAEFNGGSDRFPSTEVVARTIWEIVQEHLDTKSNQPRCVQVIVRETPTSYVTYRP